MKLLAVISGIFIASGGAVAQDKLSANFSGLPISVRDFIDRRGDCNFLWGQYIDVADRRATVDKATVDSALRVYRCNALSMDEAALKRRYAHNKAVLVALDKSRGLVSALKTQ